MRQHIPTFHKVGRACWRGLRALLGERPIDLLPSVPAALVASLLGAALAQEVGIGTYLWFTGASWLPWFILAFGFAFLVFLAGLGASHRLLGRSGSVWLASAAAVPAVTPEFLYFWIYPPESDAAVLGQLHRAWLLERPGALLCRVLFGLDLPASRWAQFEAWPPAGFTVFEMSLLMSSNMVFWYAAGVLVVLGLRRVLGRSETC